MLFHMITSNVCVCRCIMCTTQMPGCIQLGLTRLGFMPTTAWATTTSRSSSWIGWFGRSTRHPLPFPYATKQLTISCHCMCSAALRSGSGCPLRSLLHSSPNEAVDEPCHTFSAPSKSSTQQWIHRLVCQTFRSRIAFFSYY